MTPRYNDSMPHLTEAEYLIPPRYWRWLGHRVTVRVLLWLVALGVGGQRLWHAWHCFDLAADLPEQRQQPDANTGHALIDFGGQWVMGRLLVTGHGRELYHRHRQWEIVRNAYPLDREPVYIRDDRLRLPHERLHPSLADESHTTQAEWMMFWFMGEDSPHRGLLGGTLAALLAPRPFPPAQVAVSLEASQRLTPEILSALATPEIGGPLYPPTHACVMAPLAFDDHPRRAYRVAQVVGLALAYGAGLAATVLSRGGIPWSLASVLILLYPGTRAALDLAQNSTLTLAIVLWGWALASRGWAFAGGMVWGLLAFKPTWAAAFLLVPLLTGRWRFLLGMVIVGGAFVITTWPIVGMQAWKDWLAVGQMARDVFDVNQNWILLSRDLQGLPRRWLLDFTLPDSQRHDDHAATLGTAFWLVALSLTSLLTLWRGSRRSYVGLAPAFLFLGAYLVCYRFMYYDGLLSCAGVIVFLADRQTLTRATLFTWRTIGWPLPHPAPAGTTPNARLHSTAAPAPPQHPTSLPAGRHWGYVNSLSLTLLAAMALYENALIASNIESTIRFGFLERWGSGSRLEIPVPVYVGVDTLLVLALWGWWGVKLVVAGGAGGLSRNTAEGGEGSAGVRSLHEGLADEHGLNARLG